MHYTRRSFPSLVCAAALLAASTPALALLDVPTTERRALDVADLASGSEVALPLDPASLPLGDTAYLRAYEALAERGLIDPVGERLSARARARSDRRLHLEFLRPEFDLRTYVLGGADERLLYHGAGDTLDRGVNGFLTASGAALWGEHFGGEYAFQLRGSEDDWGLRTKRLYLKAQATKWSLKLGRDSIRLGPGYHGSLLLDDNAPPLDQWMLRTEEPLFFPGFLSGLGGFRLTFFNAWLDDDSPSPADPRYARPGVAPVEDPRLWGMRVSWHPTTWLDFGVSRTALYGGEGRHRYNSPKDWWELFSGTNENPHEEEGETDHTYDNDQYAALDFTLRMPFLNGLGPLRAGKVYWEYGATDLIAKWKTTKSRSWVPFQLNDVGNLGGIHLSTAVTDFRFEYADTNRPWYNHHLYGQGYTYRGLPLGHHLGPDARDYFFQVSRYFGPEWRAAFDVDLEERGRSLDTPEKRRELGLALEAYRLQAFGLRLAGRLEGRWARVKDSLDEPDRSDRTETYLGIGVSTGL